MLGVPCFPRPTIAVFSPFRVFFLARSAPRPAGRPAVLASGSPFLLSFFLSFSLSLCL